MRVGVGVEDEHTQSVLLRGRQEHRKLVVEHADQPGGAAQAAVVGKGSNFPAMRRQSRIERGSRLAGVVDDIHALALHRCDGRQGSHLAQPLAGAERQIEPGRIGAVDDVHIVVAGQHDHESGEFTMLRHHVEEFGPFRGAAGVGHVAGHKHKIERIGGVNSSKARHQLCKALVSARAATSALDAKAISLADHVEV